MNQCFLAYAFTHFAYPIKAGEWVPDPGGGRRPGAFALSDGNGSRGIGDGSYLKRGES
jgi:hypothetical protein